VTRERLSALSKEELVERVLDAQQQLEWMKRQLFGARSERRVVDVPAEQLWLGSLEPSSQTPPRTRTVREHVRCTPPQVPAADESGLRFDADVPVHTIELQDESVSTLEPEQIVEVSQKVTHRLAQRPGAYVVLRYVRKTIKRRDTGALVSPPPLPSVLEKSYADVSLLAGMLVDKFLYYLPLYRQHQRLRAAGIDVSRTSLSNWVHRSIDLLAPIYQAQLDSILHSQVLAMDETPIRAGRQAKGKMRTAYFWPLYGDRDEVAFPYGNSRASVHIRTILGDFSGTLPLGRLRGVQPLREAAGAARARTVLGACTTRIREGRDHRARSGPPCARTDPAAVRDRGRDRAGPAGRRGQAGGSRNPQPSDRRSFLRMARAGADGAGAVALQSLHRGCALRACAAART
jgi:transposase